MPRSLLALVLGAAALLAAPAGASAADLSVSDGALVLTSGAEFVDVDVMQDGATFHVYDWGETIDPGAGCSAAAPSPGSLLGEEPQSYECEGAITLFRLVGGQSGEYVFATTTVPVDMQGGAGNDFLNSYGGGGGVLDGGEGDDGVSSSGGAAVVLRGGAGDDHLRGGTGSDRLEGGEGDDSLDGESTGQEFFDEEAPPSEEPATRPEGGADVLNGGPGRDRLNGGGGADVLLGGDGRDTLVYGGRAAVSVSLNDVADDGGPGEGDSAASVEAIQTTDGDDTITGDLRANTIEAGDGKDRIDPGGGPDVVDAHAGDDTVAARDGALDDIACGDGADHVTADPEDFVDSDCETVDRAALPVVSTAPAAPTLKLTSRWMRRSTLVVRGSVLLPAGVPATACVGGGVTITITGAKRRPVSRGTTADRRCAFTARMRVAKRRRAKVRVGASFAGTPAVPGATIGPAKVSR